MFFAGLTGDLCAGINGELLCGTMGYFRRNIYLLSFPQSHLPQKLISILQRRFSYSILKLSIEIRERKKATLKADLTDVQFLFLKQFTSLMNPNLA